MNNTFKTIKPTDNIRGNRSNFYESLALDLETDEWIVHRFDVREPLGRYIPEATVIDLVHKIFEDNEEVNN